MKNRAATGIFHPPPSLHWRVPPAVTTRTNELINHRASVPRAARRTRQERILMFLKNLRTLAIALAAAVATQAAAQDKLANQAPIDKTLKSIEALKLQANIASEELEYPAIDIYASWNTKDTYSYPGMTVPDSYDIDLTGFCMPTDSRRITSNFGYRWGRAHKGLDVKVYIGDTIRAAFDGKVRIVRYEARGYGKYVLIRHPNGLETVYGHLSKQLVKPDQIVRAGEPIGLGGNTGRSTGSHLHFETRFCGIAINPKFMFDFERQDIVCDTYHFKKSKSASAAAGGVVYQKVRKGDSLSRIAARTGTTVDKLCRLNGITRKTVLRPGQVLRCS